MKLGHAKDEARRLMEAGDYPAALAAHHHLVREVPQDLDVRLGAAELLVRVGLEDEARKAYVAVGGHALAMGRPLFAAVAALAARELGGGDRPEVQALLAEVAARTGAGSRHQVRFAVRPAPPDDEQELAPASPEVVPFDELADRTLALVLDGAAFTGFADAFHPIPLLSELAPPELLAVLQATKLRRHGDGAREGAIVFREGDAGDALYFVGAGQVRVFAARDDAGGELEHARLHEGALFGEMALLTSQPRTASVAAVGDADLLEISRGALAAVAERHPAVALVLDRYARERLIKNLLTTSPLFTPFTRVQQAELLRRFEGVELAPGAEIIREGDAGRGLFVILSGELEVTSAGVPLARVHSGDVVGEMSLLGGGPTTATVRAVTPATALFLERGYFERLVTAIPEVRAYFQELAAARAAEKGDKLGRRLPSFVPAPPAASADAAAPGDDAIPLGDEDLLLV